MSDVNSATETFKFGLELGLAIIWATPWVLIAVALAATFLGLPLAALFWIIGSWPYKHVYEKRAKQKYEWRNRERAMDNDGDVPWEM